MRGSLLFAPLVISLCAWSEEPKLPELAPFLRTVIPAGGQPGKRVEIEGRGRYLDGALELRFTHPDIKADICASSFCWRHAGALVLNSGVPGLSRQR